MQTASFTALAGGALIGLAASALLFFCGRVAGISGIVAGLVMPVRGQTQWRALFVAGLLAGGFVLFLLAPQTLAAGPRPAVAVVVAGLLVGFGSRLGGGCTSGHGVCGLSRLSKQSLAATVTFMLTAMVTVLAWNHLMSGGA